MDIHYRASVIILVSITALGIIAIPFGNPKFIDRAIILELSFATLSALIWKGYSKAFYACIPIAVLVIVGNSLAPPHVNLMMTFSKPLNAIILIVGGYVLQIALIYSSLRSIMDLRSRRLTTAA
jgi:hypothetical protein